MEHLKVLSGPLVGVLKLAWSAIQTLYKKRVGSKCLCPNEKWFFDSLQITPKKQKSQKLTHLLYWDGTVRLGSLGSLPHHGHHQQDHRQGPGHDGKLLMVSLFFRSSLSVWCWLLKRCPSTETVLYRGSRNYLNGQRIRECLQLKHIRSS